MIHCKARCRAALFAALAGGFCSATVAGCLAIRDTPGPLTVEETLGAVFMRTKDSPKGHFYARANPKAKEAIWRVLEDEELKEYHPAALIVLGYIGDGSDVKKLEKRLKQTEGLLGGYKYHAVVGSFDAIGLMVRRDVKEAKQLAERMMTPGYWKQMRFSWGGDDLSFESKSIRLFMLGYELSLDPQLDKKIRTILERIDDPREQKLLREYLDPESVITEREVRQRERAPITAEDRRQLRSFFNGDLENPGPADP